MPKQEHQSATLISIIVPIYNAVPWLDTCLSSLVEQDFSAYEVLLIDDGSTDNSADIAQRYADKYQHMHYFRQANGGASIARNVGILKAQGEYLSFVDSDDMLSPWFCSHFYRLAQQHQADIFIGRNQQFTSTLNFTQPGEEVIKLAAVESIRKGGFSSCGKLFHRRLFGDFTKLYPAGIWAEDNGYIPWLSGNAENIFFSESIIYGYRISGSSSTSVSSRSLQDLPKAINYLHSLGCERSLFIFAAIKSVFTIFRRLSNQGGCFRCKARRYYHSNQEFQELIRTLKGEKLTKGDVDLFVGKDRRYAKTVIWYVRGWVIVSSLRYQATATSVMLKRIWGH